MDSCEPVDIDHDEIADEDAKWDNQKRFEELRQYNRNFNERRDETTREEASDMILKNWLQMKYMIN